VSDCQDLPVAKKRRPRLEKSAKEINEGFLKLYSIILTCNIHNTNVQTNLKNVISEWHFELIFLEREIGKFCTDVIANQRNLTK
jgi:hypothetical protein